MKQKINYLLITLLSLTMACFAEDLSQYVDPLIGTGGDGATFPGPVAPFGMLQWSPDTSDAAGGYHDGESKVHGFGLIHLNGVGCAHGQDAPIQFTSHKITQSPSGNRDQYVEELLKDSQRVSPGYYAASFSSGTNIKMGASQRAGLALVNFKKDSPASFIIAPSWAAKPIKDAEIEYLPKARKIRGYITSGNFCGKQNEYKLYFVYEFSNAWDEGGIWQAGALNKKLTKLHDKDASASITWAKAPTKPVKISVGISFVSVDQAELNLKTEIGEKSLDNIVQKTKEDWNKYLSRMELTAASIEQKKLLYTALYHVMLNPNIFDDVNGKYIGYDNQIHQMDAGRHKYVNFSLWDTYRTQAALLAILYPQEASDMVNSLYLDSVQAEGGGFPIWGFMNADTDVMCGYPAFPFIAYADAFGAKNFPAKDLLQRMVAAAREKKQAGKNGGAWWHIDDYKKGYVAAETTPYGSASYQLEYNVADYSLSQFAARLGEREISQEFLQRASQWQKLFDAQTDYIRERHLNGDWVEPFSPSSEKGFMEGNSAQQTWMVQFDLPTLVKMMGGKEKVDQRLDTFFSRIIVDGWATKEPYYWAGNEPVIHTPWIYAYIGETGKANSTIRRIVKEAFSTKPKGLPGNDDTGTMSAWLLFAHFGFYPIVPGTNQIVIHDPMVKKIILHTPTFGDIKLEQGKDISNALKPTGWSIVIL